MGSRRNLSADEEEIRSDTNEDKTDSENAALEIVRNCHAKDTDNIRRLRRNPKRQSRNAKLSTVWLYETYKDVSVIGLRYLIHPEYHVVRKVIWAVLLLCGVAITVYEIHDRVTYYRSWPVNVDFRVKSVKEMQFPTVVVCNENVIELSRVYIFDKLFI